jgi:hypothetical protein
VRRCHLFPRSPAAAKPSTFAVSSGFAEVDGFAAAGDRGNGITLLHTGGLSLPSDNPPPPAQQPTTTHCIQVGTAALMAGSIVASCFLYYMTRSLHLGLGPACTSVGRCDLLANQLLPTYRTLCACVCLVSGVLAFALCLNTPPPPSTPPAHPHTHTLSRLAHTTHS